MKKYIVICTSTFIIEIASTFYITSVADKNYAGMLFFAFIGPFLGLPFVGYMVESKTWSERIKMALISGLGYLLGAVVVITFLEINK